MVGAVFYFLVSPRFIPQELMVFQLWSIAILSIGIPAIFMSILYKLNTKKSLEFSNLPLKRLLLLCFSILIIVINNYIIRNDIPELLYFYTAYLISICCCLFLSLFKVNISLHSIGPSAFTAFIISMSLLYRINLLMMISLSFLIIGWTASSRLVNNSHKLKEVSWGVFIGFLPQLYFLFLALKHYKM